MRRAVFVVGVLLVIVGVILLGLGYYAISATQSTSVQAGSALEPPTASFVGGVTVSISWSGGSSSTQVFLTSSNGVCPGNPGSTAHGSGASGSFTASLASGTTYYLYACSSSNPATSVPETISVTYSDSGLSYLMLIGIIVAVLGAVVAILGLRMKPAVKAAESPEDVTPPEEAPYEMPAPITSSGPTPQPTAGRPPPVGVRSEPPEPQRFMPASEPETNAAPSAPPQGGARPPRICSFCGTSNEPWVTNCRKCKRPLASTASQ
ncbi:MAG TPA: hypothetical protein VGV89_07785 [Thermoplasmata archaeon]|nr:hypothetical protein [Thermoplasmata archaeon]